MKVRKTGGETIFLTICYVWMVAVEILNLLQNSENKHDHTGIVNDNINMLMQKRDKMLCLTSDSIFESYVQQVKNVL